MTEEEIHRGEIIIVKRGDPNHEEGHHGGVWKIAFADFMTAMMAFFLVMWLINAANEETKKAVASYFTPIKLTDRTSNPKGLNDPKYGNTEEEIEPSDDQSTFAHGGKLNQKVPDPVQFKEQALFTDPYAVLSEIAGGLVSGNNENGQDAAATNRGVGLGIDGGEGFHDPFDPSAWNTELGLAREKSPQESVDQPSPQAPDKDGADKPALMQGTPGAVAPEPPAAARDEADAVKPETGEQASVPPTDDTGPDAEASREALAGKLRTALSGLAGTNSPEGPRVEIAVAEGGVLISVSDEFEFGMFDIGSAVPRRETVEAMAAIGKALADADGKIIIAGHTDARRYRDKSYDNWRLSTDRAHIARYMLVRGGLADERVERIEGHAETRPATPDDPLAATNRRIEILVRVD
ncbi:MAG: flagellar motor protein MotB [Alphaproteobacteria bacterium]|nr:MAG: flagellar motor protein MotB [Alphaproteobacteria bacterium]